MEALDKIDLRLLGSAQYVSEAVEFVPGPAPDDPRCPAERSVTDARRPGQSLPSPT